jgi:nitrogen-specific signal transduction histidine kinase
MKSSIEKLTGQPLAETSSSTSENACASLADAIEEAAERLTGLVDRRPDYANANLERLLVGIHSQLVNCVEKVDDLATRPSSLADAPERSSMYRAMKPGLRLPD